MPRSQHAQWSSVQRTRRAEELALFERFALDHSPATLEPFVERYLPLARQLARRYRNSAEVEDIEQVAAIGLVKAIKRWNPHRGLAFSTFAFPTIVGELKRYLRDRSWSVKVPRSLQETSARLERATAGLAMELGRAPTVAELANRTGSWSSRCSRRARRRPRDIRSRSIYRVPRAMIVATTDSTLRSMRPASSPPSSPRRSPGCSGA